MLVRLFLSRGYNLSVKRLAPAWDEAGERRRGAPMVERSAEVVQSAVTRDRVRGATDPGPTLEASQSESLHTPRTEGTLFIVVSFPKQRVCNPGNTP